MPPPPPPPPPPRPGQSKPFSEAAKTAPNSLVANFDSTAPISGDYRVKWRGKTTEEMSFPSIMKKVEAGELGMMSQILVNDQWLTIRDFLARHKQAEAIRIAEERRRAEEEMARQLGVEKAAQQALLAHENAIEKARKHELAMASVKAQASAQGDSVNVLYRKLILMVGVGCLAVGLYYLFFVPKAPSAKIMADFVKEKYNASPKTIKHGDYIVSVALIKESSNKYEGFAEFRSGLKLNVKVTWDKGNTIWKVGD